MPSTLSHLKAFLALPFMVLVVVPAGLLYFNPIHIPWSVCMCELFYLRVVGGVVLLLGGWLFVQSVVLFVRIGKGTLAPWDPTRKLVVQGLYRHLRNPMILGVALVLLGEGLLFLSTTILLWALLFFTINAIYFPLKEEPDLEKRFGEEFREYKQHVPRWIPRWKGWRPERDSK